MADSHPVQAASTNTPVQSPLSLFMPLASSQEIPAVLGLLQAKQSELGAALNAIHTVHFARFMLLNVDGTDTLVLFTEYDGDFRKYVGDFVNQLGSIFDALLAHVADPPPTPVSQNLNAFVDWVQVHDRTTPQQGLLTFYSAYPDQTVISILKHAKSDATPANS
ncbi:MAG TPA: hypothetical protein VFZ66_24160 [Herpetosiphonaceae bacterium]